MNKANNNQNFAPPFEALSLENVNSSKVYLELL